MNEAGRQRQCCLDSNPKPALSSRAIKIHFFCTPGAKKGNENSRKVLPLFAPRIHWCGFGVSHAVIDDENTPNRIRIYTDPGDFFTRS